MYCPFPCARLAAKISRRVPPLKSVIRNILLMDFLFPALLVIPDKVFKKLFTLWSLIFLFLFFFLLERHRNAWSQLPRRLFSITWGDFWGMLIYDSVWCQYEIFTLPPPPLSFPASFFSLPCKCPFCSVVCLTSAATLRLLCARHRGNHSDEHSTWQLRACHPMPLTWGTRHRRPPEPSAG